MFQFISVSQSCLTLCNPMNCSMPGFPVHHQLPESTQTHVHCQWCHPNISSSVIPFSSCPQSFPALGSFQMSQHFSSGKPNMKMCLLSSSFDLDIPEPRKILHWHLVYLYKVTFDLIKFSFDLEVTGTSSWQLLWTIVPLRIAKSGLINH